MYSSKVYPDEDKFNTGDILLFHWRPRCNSLLDCCLTCYGKLISCFTKSKYTHSAMIVKNPPWRKDLKGLFILESSLETFPDAEDNEIKFGVQLVSLSKMLDDFHGDIYWRKLNCIRDEDFNNRLIKAQSIVHNRSYDTDILDYIKAGLNIHTGNVHKLNMFFCSSLIIFIYIKLGFLDKKLPWSVLSPAVLGTEDGLKHLTFLNCSLDKEVQIK